ncbi:MAG: hypothetical protein M1832_004857 [Thelocarpon impressellum]|nr:MAG: hypothetical protein M1832_004857 [Thelocarpon impressellum]
MAHMEVKTAQMEVKTAQLEKRAVARDERINQLEERVAALCKSSEGFQKMRRRFFQVHRRTVLKTAEYEDSKEIREGNAIAHTGDAISDAMLYDYEDHPPRWMFRDFSGVSPEDATLLGKKEDPSAVVAVLNAHATRIANGEEVSGTYQDAFQSVMVRVERHADRLRSAHDPHTPLGQACGDHARSSALSKDV